MTQITASMVKDLREQTGAGMMDAKKALVETNGDVEAAIDWLRTKGLAKAAKKAGRAAAEGLVSVATNDERTYGIAIEVNAETDFTRAYEKGQIIRSPVAHHDGNYFADAETLASVEGNGQVVFRYAEGTNPNGSINDIAGVMNARGNVLGLMPHPENLIEAAHGGSDGRGLFASVLDVIAA